MGCWCCLSCDVPQVWVLGKPTSKPHHGLCLLIDKICFGWSTFSWSLVLSPQNKIWSTPWKCFMERPQPDQNLALLGSLMLWCEWVKFGLDYHEESQGKAFVLTLTYVDRKRGLNEWFRPVVFNNNSNYWIIGANLQSLEHFYILCIKQGPINGYCARLSQYGCLSFLDFVPKMFYGATSRLEPIFRSGDLT